MLCVCVASLSFLERTFCFLSSQVSRDWLLWRGTAHVIPSPIPLPFLDTFSLSYVRWFILLMLYIVYGVLLLIAFLSLLSEMNPALWQGWTWLDSSSSIKDRAFQGCVFQLFSGYFLNFLKTLTPRLDSLLEKVSLWIVLRTFTVKFVCVASHLELWCDGSLMKARIWA